MVHRVKRDYVGVFELTEPEFGVGLRPVGGHNVSYGPVAVGEQDPLAEQALFETFPGFGVAAPGQPQVRGCVAGHGDGDDVPNPAGFTDRSDFGFNLVTGTSGAAAGQAGL